MNLTIEIIKSIPENYDNFDFSGFSTIDDDASKELGERKGYSLNLNGLKNINEEVAVNISKFNGQIKLNGISELSDQAAKNLSFHKAPLELNELIHISHHALETLVKNHKEPLYLDGVFNLPDSLAEIISNQSGLISLRGIQKLSDISAKYLSNRVIIKDGEFNFQDIYLDTSLKYPILKYKIDDKSKIIGNPFIIQAPKKEWGGPWTPELEVAEYDFPFDMDWLGARRAAKDIGDNWRIPSISELSEIYNQLQAKGNSSFTNYYYWSSSVDESNDSFNYIINFSNGSTSDCNQNDDCCLRLVRNKEN